MADSVLAALSVEEYLRRLASGDPAPGGGSASALAGALGASLVSMVCNLTIGRERYAQHDAAARQIQAQADALRAQLQQGIDRDAEAYDRLMATFGLPRGTEEEKTVRSAAIQAATHEATLVPLALTEASASVIELAGQALGKTNPNAASDLAVAALLGVSGMDGAAANVEINLASLKDEEEKARIAERLANARAGRRELADRIVAQTHG